MEPAQATSHLTRTSLLTTAAALCFVLACDPYLSHGELIVFDEPAPDPGAASSDTGAHTVDAGTHTVDAETQTIDAGEPELDASLAAPDTDALGADAATCLHLCEPGAVRCAEREASIERCADHDDDGCAEWGAPEPCGDDASCQEGVCVPPSSTTDLAIEWMDWPLQTSASNSGWGSVLTDVMQHCPPGEAYYTDDQVTQAHESTHGIDTHLGLTYTPWVGWNAFYVLEGRALLLLEPGIRKAVIAPYVPQRFRRSRYDLYLVNQTAWDDHPLYIWEEWIAYTNGTAAGVDQAQQGLWSGGWRDACMGTLEFVVYGLAVGLAVEELDPVYFEEEPAFRAFLAFSVRRALDVYRECAVISSFSWETQDAYYQDLRGDAAAGPLRAFLRRTYGDDFTEEVLDLED